MASAGIFSLPSIAAHRAGFIGPVVASAFVQALQTGALCVHAPRVWARGRAERRIVRAVVVGTVSVALCVSPSSACLYVR